MSIDNSYFGIRLLGIESEEVKNTLVQVSVSDDVTGPGRRRLCAHRPNQL